jgi:hypothetical protein
VYGKLEMMTANELHGIPKLLSSKKSSSDRDRFLPSNAASNFPYGKFSSVIQRNKTKRFLVTSTLADVANDFMVSSLSFH